MPKHRATVMALVLQIVVILVFFGAREIALATGREVVLRTGPVDPWHIVRGAHVILRYEIGQVSPCEASVRSEVYVELRPSGDRFVAGDLYARRPEALGSPDKVFIRGRVTAYNAEFRTRDGRIAGLCWIEYGIEHYFASEGVARELERGQLEAVVVIDRSGSASIRTVSRIPERATATPTPRTGARP